MANANKLNSSKIKVSELNPWLIETFENAASIEELTSKDFSLGDLNQKSINELKAKWQTH